MPVRDIKAPLAGRSRKSKYPYTEAEVNQAVKLLNDGKTPGVGPFEGENGLRDARSAAQALVRHVEAADPDLEGEIGTKAWEDDDGDAFAVVRIRE
jgi:hypothetical protein